jgi:hypothetical protein
MSSFSMRRIVAGVGAKFNSDEFWRCSGILVRDAHDQRRDVRLGRRATRAPRLRTVVLRGDESPVPTQDGVRCHDARDSREMPTAEGVAFTARRRR